MAKPKLAPEPLRYGPSKYAALHLIVSKWLRQYAEHRKKYVYVTLGGTELRDVASLQFIDPLLVDQVISYENDSTRIADAAASIEALCNAGIAAELRRADIFSFKRKDGDERPHIFFFDIFGICAWSERAKNFGDLFANYEIREHDFVIITSHLGHNPGMKSIIEYFGAQFSMLGANDDTARKVMYRAAHPSLTLHRGLQAAKIANEVKLDCIGAVSYREKSPMGIYAYAVSEGGTDLKTLVQGNKSSLFNINAHTLSSALEF